MLLIEMIEMKRNDMIELADRYGLTDDKTVKCSQELDGLLNIYRKVIASAKETLHPSHPSIPA